jgi:hypothetical protein
MMTMKKKKGNSSPSSHLHQQMKLGDQDTTYTYVDLQYPLYHAIATSTWRSCLAGILYILLALAALQYLRCIQFLRHCCNALAVQRYQIIQACSRLLPKEPGKLHQGNQ